MSVAGLHSTSGHRAAASHAPMLPAAALPTIRPCPDAPLTSPRHTGTPLHCPAGVAIAEPVYIYRVARVPNDPSYAEAHLTSGMWHLRKVRPVPQLWAEGRC